MLLFKDLVNYTLRGPDVTLRIVKYGNEIRFLDMRTGEISSIAGFFDSMAFNYCNLAMIFPIKDLPYVELVGRGPVLALLGEVPFSKLPEGAFFKHVGVLYRKRGMCGDYIFKPNPEGFAANTFVELFDGTITIKNGRAVEGF